VVDELGEPDIENQLSQTFAHTVSPPGRKWNKGALLNWLQLSFWVKSGEVEVLWFVEELLVKVHCVEHHLETCLLVEYQVSNFTLLHESSKEPDPCSRFDSEHFSGEVVELLAAVIVLVV
jgi:hypothetical protein